MFLDRRAMSSHITGYRVGHDQTDCLDRHGSLHTWRRHFFVAHEHSFSSSFLQFMYLAPTTLALLFPLRHCELFDSKSI